ncbi:CHAP domain-containing protein [Agromyces sp. CFH 90414]|uniref:CHAP domain-containing protein n=1 Tax=Agromyces agglutinans TaxID=2662258 RepID=A0A6I2FD13_9MICO|nr:amidase domain-containing protein [Agromyces agglutinans]MRG61697.1 CHAP domain-containing protein [Agromyces agglutinans]
MSETPNSPNPAVRRNRLVAIGVAAALVVGGGAATAIALGSGGAPSDASGAAAADAAAETSTDDSSGEASDRDLSPAVAAQLAYVSAHWRDTSNEEFGFLEESDCVNFASQSLLERGWTTDDEWWYEPGGDPYAHAPAWISSTAFRDYLEAHPERATALTDAQRERVKVGDIVQFDWDDSGDRDHTGIVTAVEMRDDGSVSIEYAGHTDATYDYTVDEAITEKHPGGIAYYWSVPE